MKMSRVKINDVRWALAVKYAIPHVDDWRIRIAAELFLVGVPAVPTDPYELVQVIIDELKAGFDDNGEDLDLNQGQLLDQSIWVHYDAGICDGLAVPPVVAKWVVNPLSDVSASRWLAEARIAVAIRAAELLRLADDVTMANSASALEEWVREMSAE